MHLRTHTSFQDALAHLHDDVILYTDGSCDNPKDPYASRAAWAVVIRQTGDEHFQTQTFKVVATGHCTGLQTINRAELQAFVVAVESVAATPSTARIGFCTDSQYVANLVTAIEHKYIDRQPHKQSHWDMIQRLMHCPFLCH